MKELTASIKKTVAPQWEQDELGLPFVCFRTPDLVLAFSKKERLSFRYLEFSCMEMQFRVNSSMVLSLLQEDEHGEEYGYAIDDNDFVNKLSAYLRWRITMLELLS